GIRGELDGGGGGWGGDEEEISSLFARLKWVRRRIGEPGGERKVAAGKSSPGHKTTRLATERPITCPLPRQSLTVNKDDGQEELPGTVSRRCDRRAHVAPSVSGLRWRPGSRRLSPHFPC